MQAKLTMALAEKMIRTAVKRATHDGGDHLSIAICNCEGFLIALMKMDEAPTRTARMAQLKAYTAARMKATTGAFSERIKREQIDIAYYCDPQLTAFPGGAPILAHDGSVIGAIGISGRSSDEDQIIAIELAALVRE